jgi:hypothetical protein
MKRFLPTTVVLLCIFFVSACDYDNFEPPNATLEGAVVHEGEQVGVTQGQDGLELWESGYELDGDIDVYVGQDGTFSAKLFDGKYKLVRRPGGGPWVSNSDTIRIEVNGENVQVNQGNASVQNGRLQVPVQPFFTIEKENIQQSGSTVSASFGVSQGVSSAALQTVGLYVSASRLVDQTGSGSDAVATMSASEISDMNNIDLEVDVSELESPLFARVGVKAEGSQWFLFSPVVELE